MARATMAVDEDVYNKLDLLELEQELQNIEVSFFFVCKRVEEPEEEITDTYDGKPMYWVTLPYDRVRQMTKTEATKFMIEKAKERLRQTA